jgi:hypothetical protein
MNTQKLAYKERSIDQEHKYIRRDFRSAFHNIVDRLVTRTYLNLLTQVDGNRP